MQKRKKEMQKTNRRNFAEKKKQNEITKHANDKFVLSKNGQIRQVVLLYMINRKIVMANFIYFF